MDIDSICSSEYFYLTWKWLLPKSWRLKEKKQAMAFQLPYQRLTHRPCTHTRPYTDVNTSKYSQPQQWHIYLHFDETYMTLVFSASDNNSQIPVSVWLKKKTRRTKINLGNNFRGKTSGPFLCYYYYWWLSFVTQFVQLGRVKMEQNNRFWFHEVS